MTHTLLRFLLILSIFACAVSSSLAQQIQGEVRYAESGQPTIGALVRCDGTGGISTQLTDRNGKFYFRVSPGHYTVSARAPGYLEEQKSIDMLDTQQSEYMFLRLRPAESASSNTHPKPPVVDVNVPATALKEFERANETLNSDRKEKLLEAVTHLEKAVSIYPSFLQAQLRLGLTYMDLSKWEEAEQVLRRALEIDPKTANAYFALGEVYLRQKKLELAEKSLRDGLALETRSGESHLSLARVYWERAAVVNDEAKRRSFLEQAFTEVNKALELNANLADAYLLKGNLFLRARRAKDALAEFEEYLRLSPNGQFAAETRAVTEKIRKALAEQKQ